MCLRPKVCRLRERLVICMGKLFNRKKHLFQEDELEDDEIDEEDMEDDDEVETYRLVTSIRGSSLKGMISTESPLGKAIFKKKVGERVYVKVNETAGYYVVIKKIENTQEDEGDQIRRF